MDPKSRDAVVLGTGVVAVLVRCAFYWESMGGVSREPLVNGLAQILHRLLAGPIDGVNVVRSRNGTRAAAVPPPPHIDHARDLRPRGAKTRQKLLDAGAKVLPSHGYHASRVDDIVEVAGVSHGSFYRYFQNKDDFFRVLAEDASLRMIELLDAFPASPDETAMREWATEWFQTYESNGGVISVWQEMQEADAALASFSRDVAAAVIARLAHVLDRRGFGDTTVDSLAFLAVTERLPHSVFTLRFAGRDEAIDAMVTMVRRGFMGLAA